MKKNKNHICNFYYGDEHFLIKALSFLNEGLDNGEKCYFSVTGEFREKIINQIEDKYFISGQIEFKSTKSLIKIYSKYGRKRFEEEIDKIVNRADKEGYSKVIFLGQPTYAIHETSEDDFLSWEEELTEILSNFNLQLLCTYDVNSLFNVGSNIINREVLDKALRTHTYLYSGEELYDCQQLISNV